MICNKCKTEMIRFGMYKCKTCRDAYHLAWRTKNRDHVNSESKKWVERNKEKRLATTRVYDSNNKDHKTEWRRQHIAKNRDQYRNYKASPESRRESKNRRRARLAEAVHEPYKSREIFENYDFKCVYCKGEATCLDHVIPISKGGADAPFNLVAACRPCNTSKSNKLLTEWKRPASLGVN